MATILRKTIRERIHKRIRQKLSGTAAQPRLSVYFSGRNITAQVIDDTIGKTLVSVSSLEKELQGQKIAPNVEGAQKIGKLIAERAKKQNITRVVFDRGGYTYHGKVKALADAAREGGLQF